MSDVIRPDTTVKIVTGASVSTIIAPGSQGPIGLQGPPGPAGPAGGIISATATTNGTGFTTLSPSTALAVPLNSAAGLDAIVVGRLSTGLAAASFRIVAFASNDSSNGFRIVVKQDTAMPTPPTGWDVQLSANNSTGNIDIAVQGAALQTVNWKATIAITEV